MTYVKCYLNSENYLVKTSKIEMKEVTKNEINNTRSV